MVHVKQQTQRPNIYKGDGVNNPAKKANPFMPGSIPIINERVRYLTSRPIYNHNLLIQRHTIRCWVLH
jgi:hypothetical protein